MEKQSLNKKTAEELMRIEGNVKGEIFKTISGYIRRREGDRGLSLVEKRMEELGYPIKYGEVKSHEWKKESYAVLTYLVCLDTLGWNESDIFDMGRNTLKSSLFLSLIMKQFVSIRKVFEEAPKYWEKNMDFGKLIPLELDETERYCILRIEGYKFHPISEQHIAGYFLGMAELCVKDKSRVKIEITKSVHRGEDHSEFKISW